MAFRQKKALLREKLVKRAVDEIVEWAKSNRATSRILMSLLFDRDKVICFRASEALGKVAAMEADKDLEPVRDLLRRLFWMMNDESGNTCWYAPEAIGEILYNVPILCKEFCGLLKPFLAEEPFEKGTRIAVSRITCANREIFGDVRVKLLQSLDNCDSNIRGASLIALGALGGELPHDEIMRLVEDQSNLEIYDYASGEIYITTVGNIASKLLEK